MPALLILAEVLTLLLAIPVCVHLKRTGDRAWAQHQRRRQWARLNLNTKAVARNMQALGLAAAEASAAFAKMGEVLRQAFPSIAEMDRRWKAEHGTDRPPFGGYTQRHNGGRR